MTGSQLKRQHDGSAGYRAARRVLGSAAVLNALAAVLLAILVIGLLVVVAGYDPIGVFAGMARGSLTGPGLVTTLQRAVPVIGLALALSFSFRAGQFNLGGEGQFIVGGLLAALTALATPGPGWLVIAAAAAAAAIGGATLSSVSALLFTRLAAPVFATTLLLNYPVESLASYVVKTHFKDPTTSMVATARVPQDSVIGPLAARGGSLETLLTGLFGDRSIITLVASGLSWSVLVVVLVFAGTVFLERCTPLGFDSTLVGLNPRMAEKVGVRVDRVIVVNMAIGGGIAGLVGALVVLGSHYRFIDGALAGTGYPVTALLVVMLARSNPIGVVIAGLAFTAVGVGGQAVERSLGLSSYVSTALQALAVILVSVRLVRGWANAG